MISTLVSGAQIGPPTLREYAVDPELVATRSPSAQYVGRAVPSISTSIPSMEALTLETLVSLRAKGQKSLEGGFSIPTLSRARSSTVSSPFMIELKTSSGLFSDRKPSLPKFTPITDTPAGTAILAEVRKVPSPPRLSSASVPGSTSEEIETGYMLQPAALRRSRRSFTLGSPFNLSFFI